MEDELDFIQKYGDAIVAYLASNAVSILVALLIVGAGIYAGKFASGLILKVCAKRQIDVTLARFFAGVSKITLLVIAVVLALDKIGIEITPFIALLGAGAFGFSLAVQGPISNYGAGIVLIITRPFKVEDTVTVQDRTGVVEEVNLGSTLLIAEDGEHITIPNRKVLGEVLTNSFAYRVIEGVVGVDYGCDPEEAILAITAALEGVAELAPDKTPEVGIAGFGDSSIDIGYRCWAPPARYHTVLYATNLAVFKALKRARIAIPFPQRDVRILATPAGAGGALRED